MTTMDWAPKRRELLAAAACACLGACAPEADKAKAVDYQSALDSAFGIETGKRATREACLVFFDPKCPHCAHLFASSRSLWSRAKFIWIPVRFVDASSLPLGASLLSAPDPAAALSARELAFASGAEPPAGAPPTDQALARVKSNSELFARFNAESVPYLVWRDRASGKTMTREGSMSDSELAALLGV